MSLDWEHGRAARATMGVTADEVVADREAGDDGRRGDLALVAAMLVLYVPLIFFGYGSDNDTYLVLDTGRKLLDEGTYQRSRNPGYFLFESAVGVLARVGGSVLTNAASVAMAAAALWCFVRVCRRLGVPRPRWLAGIMAVHPAFWVNATSTMDYVWALALLLGGVLLLLRRAHLLAGGVLGLAIAMRSTSAVAAALVLGFALIGQRGERRRVVLAGVIAVVVGGAFYVPPFVYAGYSLAFLKPQLGAEAFWTPTLRLARFVYKNVYFWGLVGSGMLAALVLLRGRRLLDVGWRKVVLACAAVVLAYEALFLMYPIEPPYLLPMLPAVLIVLGILWGDRPGVLAGFGAALVLYAVVNFNVARPDRPQQARGGAVGFWVERGYVVEDARVRLALKGCETYDCWTKVTGHGRPWEEEDWGTEGLKE